MRRWAPITAFVISVIPAAYAAAPNLDQQFTQTIRPTITKYCIGCHSGSSPAAQLDLKSYTTVDAVTRDFGRWGQVMDKLTAKQMPPSVAPQPPDATPPAGDRLDQSHARERGAQECRRSREWCWRAA